MNLFEAVLLGAVQGVTEFLPVSSSGHLVWCQHFLGIREPVLAFDIAVHWGTLAAVMAVLGRDLAAMMREFFCYLGGKLRGKVSLNDYPFARLSLLIIWASVPTALIGLLAKDWLEQHFHSVRLVGIAWVVTGILLVLSRRLKPGETPMPSVSFAKAFWIGAAQGIAVLPGISRSGMTILAGLCHGLERREAARFSFLLAIPAILGAGLLKVREGFDFFRAYPLELAAGFLTSAIVGYLAITWLLSILEQRKFYLFGYYCLAMGVLTLVFVR